MKAVSVVIPTVGRPSLVGAIHSALGQTHAVGEVIVVADTDQPVTVPDDDRIRLLHSTFRDGPARPRQLGIDAARGPVIAMLDDDDEWMPTKLERQLDVAARQPRDRWIISSRMEVRDSTPPGPAHNVRSTRKILPRTLIAPGQPVTDYLFRVTGIRAGYAELQTSTLLFPTELARAVRWDSHAGAPQDEFSWLIDVQRAFPDVRIIQLPDVLSAYNTHGPSVSRQAADDTASYIAWGLDYLATESPRVRGDYLCTYPVSAAVSAHSVGGVRLAVHAAFRHGRPGPNAVTYALLNAARVVLRSRKASR